MNSAGNVWRDGSRHLRKRDQIDPNDVSCPQCRCPVLQADIVSVLGRPLMISGGQRDDCEEVEIDEFTRVYLEELEELGEARQCPACRIWISKEEGCDNMKCRCGCIVSAVDR